MLRCAHVFSKLPPLYLPKICYASLSTFPRSCPIQLRTSGLRMRTMFSSTEYLLQIYMSFPRLHLHSMLFSAAPLQLPIWMGLLINSIFVRFRVYRIWSLSVFSLLDFLTVQFVCEIFIASLVLFRVILAILMNNPQISMSNKSEVCFLLMKSQLWEFSLIGVFPPLGDLGLQASSILLLHLAELQSPPRSARR